MGYRDLMPFKFKRFDLLKLRENYPERKSACGCFEGYLATKSNTELWIDAKTPGENESERELHKCELNSRG